MNKNKVISGVFVLIGLLVIVGALYVILSYTGDTLSAITKFITTNDLSKLDQCGIVVPEEFNAVNADLTTAILPALYIGLPLLFLVVSFLMFVAGMYYKKGKDIDESRTKRKIEKEGINYPITHPFFSHHEFFLIIDNEHFIDELGMIYEIEDVLNAIALSTQHYWKGGWYIHPYCRISDYTVPKFIDDE